MAVGKSGGEKVGAGQTSETVLTRRRWLRSLLVGGSISLAAGAVALVRMTGYAVDPWARARLRVLAPWQYLVVRAAADRIVAPDRSEGVPTASALGVAEFIDGYLIDMSPSVRGDLFQFLRYLEQLAPLGYGFLHRFTALSEPDQDKVLSELESSRIDPIRAGFQAMKSLAMLGYYRDPRTFGILGYKGPFIDAPESGAP
jgi:Gluconate 2-dehydrogenase subunit 3